MSTTTPVTQSESFEEINQLIWKHLEARDWHNNPTRGLAISLALEAGELLEHYQWDFKDKSTSERREAWKKRKLSHQKEGL